MSHLAGIAASSLAKALDELEPRRYYASFFQWVYWSQKRGLLNSEEYTSLLTARMACSPLHEAAQIRHLMRCQQLGVDVSNVGGAIKELCDRPHYQTLAVKLLFGWDFDYPNYGVWPIDLCKGFVAVREQLSLIKACADLHYWTDKSSPPESMIALEIYSGEYLVVLEEWWQQLLDSSVE